MAVTDEVLTRYKIDIQQPEQQLQELKSEMVETATVGTKAFSDVGKSADAAGRKIVEAFGPPLKSIQAIKDQVSSLKTLMASATDPDKINRFAAELNSANNELKRMQVPLQGTKTMFNALGNSINQLSRELPAFTMNLNTGFLAISNNLPALFDAIRELKTQNADLAASGKETKSVLGSIAGAVFSWQTALSIGITLLTVYGGKMVDFIVGNKEAKKSEEDLRKEEEKLNDERMRGVNILNAINVQRGKDIATVQKTRGLRQGGIELQKFELEIMKLKGATDQEVFEKEQDIRRNEIVELKELLNNLELYGDETLATRRQIDAKEREIDLAKAKFDAEQDEKARKRAEERAAFEQRLREENAKRAEGDREMAASEITRITDEYFAEKDRESKADEDADRQRRELLGESVKQAMQNRADRKKVLEGLVDDETKSFEQRKEALKNLYDEGLISAEEYTKSDVELSYQRKIAALSAISEIGSALGAFSQLLGENTEAGKALAIAQTTIDTYVAAQKAYLSQMQFTPDSPIRATIAAAVAVASGLARVAKIASVSVPKPAAGTAPAPTGQSAGFKDGVVDLNGPGTGTSDSIPAWLSRGESVITAKSTAAKSDELKALNDGVVNYEMLLYKKYVKPAVDAEQEKQNQFAANVARSIAMHSAFNDTRIVKAIEKNRPATGKDIAKLSEQIAKQNRIAKFESNLKQSK